MQRALAALAASEAKKSIWERIRAPGKPDFHDAIRWAQGRTAQLATAA